MTFGLGIRCSIQLSYGDIDVVSFVISVIGQTICSRNKDRDER